MPIKPVDNCKHNKFKFIGLQPYKGKPDLDLKLYNCVDCGGTFSHKTLIKLSKERSK